LIATVLATVWASWGVPGPGSGSLTSWGRQITEPIAKLGLGDIKSGQGRQAGKDLRHYMLGLVSEARARARAGKAADPRFARLLGYFDGVRANDDETARALAGLVVGSASTTAGTFIQGLARYAGLAGNATITGLPSLGKNVPGDAAPQTEATWPLYDQVIAGSLRYLQAAAPDYLYRTYLGKAPEPFSGGPKLAPGDKVIVWLGGAAAIEPDLRFGGGPHHCPGMQMAKAVMEGTLTALKEARALERQGEAGVNFAFELGELVG
jgi:cytochrome P450